MITERKAANALSGKTARACDGCSRRRARWFCAADDAFLCQSCDESVHSANQLASRHERVRLEYASFKTNDCLNTANYPPAWHQGFTKKARTPRYNFHKSLLLHQQFKDEEKVAKNPLLLVPEIGGEESVDEEDEDQLLYRVPVFDPFAAELCIDHIETPEGTENDDGNMVFDGYGEQEKCDNLDNLPGFLPSDMDLAQFAADVENLLGSGLDEDSTDIKNLGLINCKEEDDDKKLCLGMEKIVKVKDEQEMQAITGCQFDQVFDMERESLDWNLNYESSITGDDEEEEAKVVPVADDAMMNRKEKIEIEKRSSLLRLNYDGVITAWASQGSPWTTGSRPQLNPDDCWPDCVGAYHKDGHYIYGGTTCGNKGAREARVLRYKEKRRTRLFSKKIRYEVRKLNAEKRPRMKGRFVKRTCLVPTVFPYINKK